MSYYDDHPHMTPCGPDDRGWGTRYERREGVSDAPRVRKHVSGLRVQEFTGPAVRAVESHTLPLPPCCPVSGNPQEGSTITLRYRPDGWCLEVYSLARLVADFANGFPGRGPYPAERNMEGMIGLLAQMAADALAVPVWLRASLVLDAGEMELRVRARPAGVEPSPAEWARMLPAERAAYHRRHGR